jgi:hypothetical protein
MRRADNLTNLHVPTVLKSGSFNLLETSGPVKACTGIALPLQYTATILYNHIGRPSETDSKGEKKIP